MKKTLKLLFKSLVNNDACIEGGRHKPWWIALLLAFFSVIFAILPITVTAIKTNGDDFIKNSSFTSEVGMQRYAEDLDNLGYDLVVKIDEKGSKYLDLSAYSANRTDGLYEEGNLETGKRVYYYNRTVEGVDSNGNPNVDTRFVVYVIEEEDSKSFNAFKDLIVKAKVNPMNGIEDDLDASKANKTFLLLGKKYIFSALYKVGSTQPVSSISGTYHHFEENYNLRDLVKVTDKEGNVISKDTTNPEEYSLYREGSFKNWKSFFRTSYKELKKTNVLTQTGLMAGIDAVLVVFMGLMIFILTRGKKNPFRIYTFWETQKIAYWAAFTPALLSLGLGFLLQSFAMMLFILLLGVRIMWMSMRSLRPQQ